MISVLLSRAVMALEVAFSEVSSEERDFSMLICWAVRRLST